jgi:signal transduction histidine kinase
MLQELAAHQVMVKEEERKRIAREIHDELGQRLTVLRMDVLMLPKILRDHSAPLKQVISQARNSIDDILRIVRNIASDLRPAVLDFGIVAAIEWLLDEFSTSLNIPCECHNMIEDSIGLSDEQATGIFRILQESLTNVARHAHAAHIEVTLKIVEDRLFIEIKDDGIGFDSSQVGLAKSYGLVGMRERATMLGGEIEIHGVPGQGAIVRAYIPLAV